jgi:hypothetical protein
MPDVIVQLAGQLCNHLFIIAAGYAQAKRAGKSLVIRKAGGRPDYFSDWYRSFITKFNDQSTPEALVWREPRFSFVPIPQDATTLVGFFQSEKYFSDVSGDIRALFRLPSDLETQIRTKWAHLLEDTSGCCTIHIRRGDYFWGEGNQSRHGILTNTYYERAMRAADARRYLVFSDDVGWCQQQPWLAGCEFVDEPDRDAALYLLTQFPMLIGSNSTFSWWGAYLGVPKQVWMPARWFGPGGPQDYQDVYLRGWHRVPLD